MPNDKELEQLRDIAIHFKVEPLNTVGNAARLSNVIKALTGLQESFKNFVKIEFSNTTDFQEQIKKNPGLLKTFIDDLQLLMVDVKFGSFETSLAPDLSEIQSSIFKDEILEWKRNKFEEYKEDILGGDYDSVAYLNKVNKRYKEEELKEIFLPIFESAGSGKEYKLEVWNNVFDRKRIVQPSTENIKYYKPDTKKKEEPSELKTYQVIAKVSSGDEEGISKKNIKKIVYSEPLEHDVYPFVTELIKSDDTIYVLNEKIKSDVSFEDGMYFISNALLDINVWAASREEAEEAFAFTFDAIYKNFANEDDNNLTAQAQLLKNKIQNLISQTLG